MSGVSRSVQWLCSWSVGALVRGLGASGQPIRWMLRAIVWSRSTWIVVCVTPNCRPQHLLEPVQQCVLVDPGRRDHVHRDGVEAARDRPRVDVVHLADALARAHSARPIASRVEVGRRALEQDPRPARAIRSRARDEAQRRDAASAMIGSAAFQPNAATSTPATTTPTEPATSATVCSSAPSQVEVVAAACRARTIADHRGAVDGEPGEAEQDHAERRAPPAGRRAARSPRSRSARRAPTQREAVDERREDLDAAPAVRAPARARRAARGSRRRARCRPRRRRRRCGRRRRAARRSGARSRRAPGRSRTASVRISVRRSELRLARAVEMVVPVRDRVSPPGRAAGRARRGRRRAPRGAARACRSRAAAPCPARRKARASGCAGVARRPAEQLDGDAHRGQGGAGARGRPVLAAGLRGEHVARQRQRRPAASRGASRSGRAPSPRPRASPPDS